MRIFDLVQTFFSIESTISKTCRNAYGFSLAILTFAQINSPAFAWEPVAGLKQIPIWPENSMPHKTGKFAVKGKEEDLKCSDMPVAGKPWLYTHHVSRPTVTLYPAKGKNTGACIIVFPGGGYQILAMDLEGTEICDWFTARGVNCVLLKYRVPGEGVLPAAGHYPKSPIALEDAQRAVSFVRQHAKEWNINPKKIGVLGFSAGGHLSAAMSTHHIPIYKKIDATDDVSCRPDFAVPIYPGRLAIKQDDGTFKLNPDIKVTSKTPPVMIIQAQDDPVDRVENSLVFFQALRNANVPTEMHIYPKGGHAFGLRHTKNSITDWPELVMKWLSSMDLLHRDHIQ